MAARRLARLRGSSLRTTPRLSSAATEEDAVIAHGPGGAYDEVFLFGAVLFVIAGGARLVDKQAPKPRWRGAPMILAGLAIGATPFVFHLGVQRQAKIRIPSTARFSIVSPAQGEIVHGTVLHVQLDLQGASVVDTTTIKLRPDRGHIHLSIDGTLLSVKTGVRTNVPIRFLKPGRHLLQAEFVATDHGPFSPRVLATSTFVLAP